MKLEQKLGLILHQQNNNNMSYLSINYDAIELDNGIYNYGSNWVYGNYSQGYIEEVLKCIDFCKPEIYFHSIFFILNKGKKDDDNEYININTNHIDAYDNFCKSIFLLKCGLNIDNFDEEDIVESVNQNNPIVKHFDAYYETIELYVNGKSNIMELGFSISDDVFGDDKTVEFFLNVMLISYFLTTMRFYKNISNDDLFSIDNIWHPDGYKLTIYFTPFALLNRNFVHKTYIAKPKDCLKIFFKSVNILQYVRSNSEEDQNIEIEIFCNGESYIVEMPIENPFYYLNGYLQNILSANYLDFLSQNKLLTFKAR